MNTENKMNRRDFVKTSAMAAGGAFLAGAAGATQTAHAAASDASKILHYNPNMEYRRLGKTGLMVSSVGLGGHSRSNPKERAQIIDRCIQAGINFIDCAWWNEAVRDAGALRALGKKMHLLVSHGSKEPRNPEYRTAKKLMEAIDELLLKTKLDYVDVWRITCYEPGGRHTFNTSCEIVEALTTAKKQGKVGHIGFSTHDRRWIKFMVEYFPEVEVVCFPFTTMSKRAPKDSLFDALKKCDIGAVGIKPFAAGSLFTGDRDEDMRRARLAIRYILYATDVHPIPGMNSLDQVDNVALAVKERKQYDIAEFQELDQLNRETWARLPRSYQWLRDWEYV